MSILHVETSTAIPNFLDSAVGLVCKTGQLTQAMGVADGKYKTVKAGTPFPSNDASAIGIVYQDADVTDGDAVGSIMVAGRVITERLALASAAKTALQAKGFVFVDAEETVRGFRVTYVTDDGAGTPPVDNGAYLAGDEVTVSTEYPLTKASNTQVGWALTSGGEAVESFQIEADTTLYPVWQAN